MVNRVDKKIKAKRWCVYFPKSKVPIVRKWKNALKQVVQKGKASLSFQDVSGYRVDLVWENAVMHGSAARLITMAKEIDATFQISGEPKAVFNDEANCESAENADIADDNGLERPCREKKAALSVCSSEVAGCISPPTAPSDDAAKFKAASVTRQYTSQQLALKVECIASRFAAKNSETEPSPYDVQEVLGVGAYGEVFAATTRGETVHPVAVKYFNGGNNRSEQVRDLAREVRRYAAVSSHPNILQLLDVGLFRDPLPGLHQPMTLGLVFERYTASLHEFLKATPLENPGQRHVLKSMLLALAHLHDSGVLHADLKPANILLRGTKAYYEGFRKLVWGRSSGASARKFCKVDLPTQVAGHLPETFEVVLGDLGSALLIYHQDRDCSLDWKNLVVPVCTPQYRSPDMMLGSLHFGADLDMWSLGCVAAEIYKRAPIFPGGDRCERRVLDAQFAMIGTPTRDSNTHAWIKHLPFSEKFYGKDVVNLPAQRQDQKQLEGCPPKLADFVWSACKLHPDERMTVASALSHSLFRLPQMSSILKNVEGKNGEGSIAEGSLDDEVLAYLQNCQTWGELHAEFLRGDNSTVNRSMGKAERELQMKREFVGFIDEKKPPKVLSLNSDSNLEVVKSPRLASFVKALRRRAERWLHQLTQRVRAEIRRVQLPREFLETNGGPFMEECFAENAFVYASVQLLKIGKRQDGWHTDGGASLLHIGLTLFGSRNLLIEKAHADCISLPQRPGTIYVGNLCALNHNVSHEQRSEGNYGKGSEQVQISVMLRTDVFRQARARKLNAVPGPAELFHVVNAVTAKHIAEEPFPLPTIEDVLAESAIP